MRLWVQLMAGVEGMLTCGELNCLTAKRCGVVEQWRWAKGLFSDINPAGARGANARVVQPEMFSRDTHISCIDACAGWIATGCTDGSLDVWDACKPLCEATAASGC
jgi:hypothetical protein